MPVFGQRVMLSEGFHPSFIPAEGLDTSQERDWAATLGTA